MKRYRILSVLLLTIIFHPLVYAQEHELNEKINETLDSVKIKLSNDTATYEQFLLLGKCVCNDIAKHQFTYPIDSVQQAFKKRNISFRKNYAWLNFMHFPISSLFIEDSLYNVFERQTIKLLNDKYRLFSERSEKYKIRQASELVCESIYRNTSENQSFYSKFINNDQNYIIINSEFINYHIEILRQYINEYRYNNNGW